MTQFIRYKVNTSTWIVFIRIVTFGNSLTVGFQSPTPENPMGKSTPYGLFLQEMMGGKTEILVMGVSGELTSEMALRLDRQVIQQKPDFVVILGGSNDLGWGLQPLEIMDNLIQMYERVKEEGIIPVSLTVPSIRGFDALIPSRKVLNQMMMDYCKKNNQPCVDLFTGMAEPDTLRLAEAYSNDGLHFTTLGYRRIAEMLYQEYFKIIQNKE